jgi:mannonate dehydratase
MRIDPASDKCDPFYAKLAELKLPLLTHGGLEKAVEADEAQKLSNPLRLRRALDAGVKVIVCHCASSGDDEDLDAPGKRVPSIDLFLRLMDDPKYADRVYGDISALVQFNRVEQLERILERGDLHTRLINGSDYPLPAINALVRTSKLVELGFIDETQRALLNEIDRHNPLLFDFVLKRTLRGSGGEQFAPAVFMPPADLFPG